jgi:hypothetical protein
MSNTKVAQIAMEQMSGERKLGYLKLNEKAVEIQGVTLKNSATEKENAETVTVVYEYDGSEMIGYTLELESAGQRERIFTTFNDGQANGSGYQVYESEQATFRTLSPDETDARGNGLIEDAYTIFFNKIDAMCGDGFSAKVILGQSVADLEK